MQDDPRLSYSKIGVTIVFFFKTGFLIKANGGAVPRGHGERYPVDLHRPEYVTKTGEESSSDLLSPRCFLHSEAENPRVTRVSLFARSEDKSNHLAGTLCNQKSSRKKNGCLPDRRLHDIHPGSSSS
jgi:hypothetical protein